MLKVIETYLALRRATGFAMLSAEYLLKSFAAFAAERGQTHVEIQTAIDWAALGPSVGQRDARLRAVCRFVRHVRVEDIGHELPPPDYFGARKRRRTPHIYTTGEINRLIDAGLRLRPMRGMCPCTEATLIALLSATGLRISEALKLTIADVTRDGLLIRETKFRKTRLVPLHDTAGIKSRSGHRPRLHDLRHTFAVRALQGAPTRRGRCGAHMVALATYMGHVNIYATYWYLEATADLLRDVATASEAFMSEVSA